MLSPMRERARPADNGARRGVRRAASASGRPRSRRGRPGVTSGATTPRRPPPALRSVAPRTSRRATRGVAALVNGTLRDAASDAIGEPVVAFKDKINYKQPGGAGFRPHQDRVAYPGVDARDVDPRRDRRVHDRVGLPLARRRRRRGARRPTIAASCAKTSRATSAWTAVELEPGEAVLLDGLRPALQRRQPHRRDRAGSWSRATRPRASGYTRDAVLRRARTT